MSEPDFSFCKDCKEHGQLNLRIENIKEQINKHDEQHKEDIKIFEECFKNYREYFNSMLDKCNFEVKKIVTDNQQLREAILEIKNAVNSANEKTALMFTQVTEKLNIIFQRKRDFRQYVVFPIIAGIIISIAVGILGFIVGKTFK